MKKNQCVNSSAVCPYYRKENKNAHRLYCEGFLDSVALGLFFSDGEDYELHVRGYCESVKGWPQCPIARMITEETEDNEYR